MADWGDVLAYLDLVDPIEGVISTFRFADWSGAKKRAGLGGVLLEIPASFLAANCWTIKVRRHSGWTGFQVEQLLKRHGVRIWGRGFDSNQLYFHVKTRQARWAEYLLLRRGIPVTSTPFDPLNSEYAKQYAPGSEPPTRQTKRQTKPDWPGQLRSYLLRLLE